MLPRHNWMINLNDHWQIDTKGHLIALRDDLSWWKKQKLFWVRRIEVRKLYRDMQAWLASEDGMIHPEFMWHGNFEASEEVRRNVETVFQLKPAWTIDDGSLRALTRGPLINADGTKILVPSHGALTEVVLLIERWPLYRLIVIIGALTGLVASFF